MPDVMIKPVRSYLDGGRVRKAGGDAYSHPSTWLANWWRADFARLWNQRSQSLWLASRCLPRKWPQPHSRRLRTSPRVAELLAAEGGHLHEHNVPTDSLG